MNKKNEINKHQFQSGNELELMLSGKKPMAVFFRRVGENIDETNGQPFFEYVKKGIISRSIFYISNNNQNFTIIYYVYTVVGEEWRAVLYRKIKKIGQSLWCKDLEIIEGTLLGYSLDENEAHTKARYK